MGHKFHFQRVGECKYITNLLKHLISLYCSSFFVLIDNKHQNHNYFYLFLFYKRRVKYFYFLLGLVQSRVMYARQESVFDAPHRQEGRAMVVQRENQVVATTTLPFLRTPVQTHFPHLTTRM